MAAVDLTTLVVARAWLGITDNSQDVLLTRLITSTSRSILNSLNRGDLHSQAYTETYDGSGTNRLTLINFPVTAVSAVTIDGISIPAALNTYDYGFGFDAYSVHLTNNLIFTRGKQNVSVTYTAGYASIPEDIEQATLLALQNMVQVQKMDTTIGSESTGGYSVSYRQGAAGALPPEVQQLLKTYRRVTWA